MERPHDAFERLLMILLRGRYRVREIKTGGYLATFPTEELAKADCWERGERQRVRAEVYDVEAEQVIYRYGQSFTASFNVSLRKK